MKRLAWDRCLTVALSLLALWPFLPGLLRGEVPGQAEVPLDGAHGLYLYALVGDALAGRGSWIHTDAMWFPTGRPLLLVVQNVLDAVLAQPFLAALGPQGGLALFTAVILVSNGIAGGWLGEVVGGRGWAGPTAAAVVAFAPYVAEEAEVGRATQAMLAPMVVSVGLAWRVSEGRGRGFGLGVALATAGLGYWFYGLFSGVIVAALLLGALIEGSAPRGPVLRGAAVALALGLTVAGPFAWFSAANWTDMAGSGLKTSPIPNPTNLLSGWFWIQHPRVVAYVPQGLFGLAALAAIQRPRARNVAVLLAVAVLSATAVGRTITLLGIPFPTPLRLLQALPGFARFWWPHRALGAATVGLAVLAARVVASGSWRWITAGLLATVLAQSASVPGALTTWTVPGKPPWASVGTGAVLTLPMLDPEVGKRHFAEWTWFRRPLVNGMSMWDEYLWPAEWRAWAKSEPLVNALLFIEKQRPHGRKKPNPADLAAPGSAAPAANEPEPPMPDLGPAAVAHLVDQGVDLVVADKARTPRVSVALLSHLCGEPACDGEGAVCWWPLRPEPREAQ